MLISIPKEAMLLIYFAAPLFSRAERLFNENLTQRLEAQGFTVFLPQRDGVEKNKPPYSFMEPKERRQALFHLDKQQIFACDIFCLFLMVVFLMKERVWN